MDCIQGLTRRRFSRRNWRRGVRVAAICGALFAPAAKAETIGGALAKAYLGNPDINQQRAAVRASDENSPRPTPAICRPFPPKRTTALPHRRYGLRLGLPNPSTSLLSRLRRHRHTERLERQSNPQFGAPSQIGMLGAREKLRNTEQNVLLGALTYYMDVLRDTAILDLDRNNVEVLQEQLRQTQDRFNVGEVTRTDVAQAEASLAGAGATR